MYCIEWLGFAIDATASILKYGAMKCMIEAKGTKTFELLMRYRDGGGCDHGSK